MFPRVDRSGVPQKQQRGVSHRRVHSKEGCHLGGCPAQRTGGAGRAGGPDDKP